MVTCKENVLPADATNINKAYRWDVDYICTDCMERVKALLTSNDG